MLSLWLFLLPVLSLFPLAPAEKGLEFPQYDGKDRVLDINDKNYKKALKKDSMVCLFYHGPIPDSKEQQKQQQMTELVLEVKYEDQCRERGGAGIKKHNDRTRRREKSRDEIKNVGEERRKGLV